MPHPVFFNRIKKVIITSIVMILSLASVQSFAIKGINKITEVEGITEYRLKNGLQVLLVPDQTQDKITVNVTYHVGSKHENYGETGMAHLLEHLLFKGTPKHPNIPDELSARGAKPNGTTSQDRTNYYETFAATEDNLKWALSLEADRMVNSFVRREDLDSEMSVVRNELERGENSPFRVTLQKVRAASYMWHNYGKSTIGAVSDLENVSIDKLRAFYKTYYQPDNATLIVAGKFDEQNTLKMIKKTFGKIKKPKRTLPAKYTIEAASDGERIITVRRVGDIQLTLASYHTPAGAHEDNAALGLISFVIGDTPTGRLHKTLVETKLATQVFAWSDTNADSSNFVAGAILDKKADITLAENAYIAQIQQILKQPITQKEFERAQRAFLNGFEKSAANTQSLAIGLSEWVTLGDWRLRFLRRDQVTNLTLEEVNKVADKYFKTNNRVIGRFIPADKPERVTLPAKPDVATVLKGYKGNKVLALGEAFDPSFENIANKIVKTHVDNTITLSSVSKKTRGEKATIKLRFNYGNAQTLAGSNRFIDVFGQMLTKGTQTKTREQITDAFDAINTQLSISSSGGSTLVSLSTKKEYAREALILLSDLLINSTFSEKELELVKKSRKTSLEFALQDPNEIAQSAANKKLTPVDKTHPVYEASIQEEIDYLTTYNRETLVAFHQQFLSADNLLVTAVGDIDTTTLANTLKKQFGDWKKGNTYQKLTLPYTNVVNETLTFNTPDKENGIFLAVDLFNLNAQHPDYAALKLGNTVFGGGFINSRLANRMRQKEGWSYGVGASINGSQISERTRSIAYAIGAPQNLDKIHTAYKEELTKALADGFTVDEISKAQTGIKQRNKLARASDGGLANMLMTDLFFEREFIERKGKLDKLLSLNKEQVKEAMNKYYDVNNMLFIKAGDKSKM